MQAPSVPKITKFLADIKSRWLDNGEAAGDPEGTYCALLKMELLLRGVIVEEDKKLWEAILSSVGKPLLKDKNVPKAFISGGNVIAGKLAEQFSKTQQQFDPMLMQVSGPTKRAQDLKDRRLLALLRQDFDPLEVAKGYFLRAAQANPEKPAIWRQVLDVMIRQHNDEAPFEAQTIIEKLVTIASSKGNVRRSAELRLKLCLSYLNTDRTISEESLSVVFAGSNSHHPEKNLLKLTQSAKSTLYECAFEKLEDKDQMMHKILRLRVELAVEDAEIDNVAQERFKANVNRSNTTSMTAIRSICKEEVLLQPEDPVREASFGIRDVLLHTLSTANTYLLPRCIDWTQIALLRFRARAEVWKSDDGWEVLLAFGDARSVLAASKLDAGRPLSSLEEVLFGLGHADAEFLQGGSVQRACDLYLTILAILEKDSSMDGGMRDLFRSHCNNGLAIACKRGAIVPENGTVEHFASNTLRILQCSHPIAPFHLWHDPALASKAIAYHLSVARQLFADSLIAKGNCEEAQTMLEAAVRDSPRDATAAVALGTFLLRVALFFNAERSEQADKQAQIYLLKAAKLDPSQARPFALLGFWFESRGDRTRAKGCYSKCLILDPCDPVAGRGILRLETDENSQKYIDAALAQKSSWNGWAWNATGLKKTMMGEDELALVALLKATRCQDIRKAQEEVHDIFFQQNCENLNEEAVVFESIGFCYRRLGRHTAAMRAFYLAIELSKAENLFPLSALCSCAQVELELALFEEAAEKFAEVLQNQESGDFQFIAAYGLGIALLSLAERDLQDGKAGSAFAKVTKAIDECLQCSGEFSCKYKLLGDLFSFGALIPSALFYNANDGDTTFGVRQQLDFASRGEAAYRSALDSIAPSLCTNQSIIMQASYHCDIASNILLQAKVFASTRKEECTGSLSKSLYNKAANEFKRSLDLNPISAVAWCGLGCAVDDALMAQPSDETMHVFTQVADSPLMWINRAFILEQKSRGCLGATTITDDLKMVFEASDAYRAALQVTKQPDALIGLAVTGMLSQNGCSGLHGKHRKNSLALLNEYLAMSSYLRTEARLLAGLVGMEQASVVKNAEWSSDEIETGRRATKAALSNASAIKWMNIESMENCLQKPEGTKLESKRDDPDAFGTQAKIIWNPDDPIQWIVLAKQAARKVDSTNMVQRALRMAQKASDMLTMSLSRLFDKSSNPLEANMMSEALSLVCSLQSIRDDQMDSKSSWGFDLQHAMMMCPDSKLARVLLQCNNA
ncbi:MAG: hypothetical protein SGBAC_010479 [Bacillariaceae sp.]